MIADLKFEIKTGREKLTLKIEKLVKG